MKSRYDKFIEDGIKMNLVPFIEIKKSPSDYYTYYRAGKTRLDKLSYDYYGNPNYGWLILQANPNVSPLEFNIPNKTLLRIPYPLERAISDYEGGIDKYKELNGL